MIRIGIEEKESPSEEKCWLRVMVVGKAISDEQEVLEEGERIRGVLQKLEKALGFEVRNGLPVKSDTPYYFFIVECLPKNKDRTRETIKEVAEITGKTYYAH